MLQISASIHTHSHYLLSSCPLYTYTHITLLSILNFWIYCRKYGQPNRVDKLELWDREPNIVILVQKKKQKEKETSQTLNKYHNIFSSLCVNSSQNGRRRKIKLDGDAIHLYVELTPLHTFKHTYQIYLYLNSWLIMNNNQIIIHDFRFIHNKRTFNCKILSIQTLSKRKHFVTVFVVSNEVSLYHNGMTKSELNTRCHCQYQFRMCVYKLNSILNERRFAYQRGDLLPINEYFQLILFVHNVNLLNDMQIWDFFRIKTFWKYA